MYLDIRKCLNKMKFDIVLATYNGSYFISLQLDSILNQKEYVNKIYIRDDGSNDRTVEIIKEYQGLYSDLIFYVEDGLGNLGPKESFIALCGYSEADYVAFSDQDDIWESEKLKVISDYIKSNDLENIQSPTLIHSDLSLINSEGASIGASYIKSSDINVKNIRIHELLTQRNIVTGCACVVNRSLLNESRYVDSTSFHMHDFYFACIASMYDGIHFIDLPLVRYRQHERNCVGYQKKVGKYEIVKKLISGEFSLIQKVNKIDNYFRFDWSMLGKRVASLIKIGHENNKASLPCHNQRSLNLMRDLANSNSLSRLMFFWKILKVNVQLLPRFRSLK